MPGLAEPYGAGQRHDFKSEWDKTRFASEASEKKNLALPTFGKVGVHAFMPLAKTRYTSIPHVKKVSYIQNTLSVNNNNNHLTAVCPGQPG